MAGSTFGFLSMILLLTSGELGSAQLLPSELYGRMQLCVERGSLLTCLILRRVREGWTHLAAGLNA